MWPVSLAKDFDIAWGNIVVSNQAEDTASFAVNHDRDQISLQARCDRFCATKMEIRMKQRFILLARKPAMCVAEANSGAWRSRL